MIRPRTKWTPELIARATHLREQYEMTWDSIDVAMGLPCGACVSKLGKIRRAINKTPPKRIRNRRLTFNYVQPQPDISDELLADHRVRCSCTRDTTAELMGDPPKGWIPPAMRESSLIDDKMRKAITLAGNRGE